MSLQEYKNNDGFSALVLVLIIGISSLIVAKSTTWLSLRELDMSVDANMAKLMNYSLETCEEDALLALSLNKNFQTSNQKIVSDECSCTYSSDINGSQRNIDIKAICSYYSLESQIIVDASDKIKIISRTKK